MNQFIGRERELAALRKILKTPSASVMIYGKRKVGKTTLIMQALSVSTDPTVYYECLKAPLQDNINGLTAELVRKKILPVPLRFSSFTDLFAYLNTTGKTLNIVIDEYPYLKEMENAGTVDTQFQSVIDNHIGNIRLFLSGSHIGMMKDLLAEKNAMYGRFSLTLQLRELNYREAAAFYPQKSLYDRIALYSVFGGSPFVNGFLDPAVDLKTNIVETVLNPLNPVCNYAEHLLISDYAGSVNAERILFAIANGKKKYGEIEEILDMKNNGLLSKQLASLLNMEIVAKNYPINRPDDKKKISYELCDNLLRFYYAFVYRNKSALTVLGADAFYDAYIAQPITTFISHRFEEICRTYFSLLAKDGKLPGVINIGTYYYDDSATRTNGEFDVVLQHRSDYDIYEVKYYTSPLRLHEIEEEAEKIRRIKGLTVGKIGFISVSGYAAPSNQYVLIDGAMLYKE